MTNAEILDLRVRDLRKIYRYSFVKPKAIFFSAEEFDSLCDLPGEVAELRKLDAERLSLYPVLDAKNNELSGLRALLLETQRAAARLTEERDEARAECARLLRIGWFPAARRPHEVRGSAASNACLGAA